MATDVLVPQMGESIKQAVLLKWHKTDGQAVSADEPVAELETDKANLDVSAPIKGVLKRIRKEGETVAVGEVIARVEEGAGSTAAAPAKAPTAPPAPSAPPAPPAPAPSGATDDLSPAVRALVAENRLDAKVIPATGRGGRLSTQDVQSYLASRGSPVPPAAPPPAPPAPAPLAKAPSPPKPAAPPAPAEAMAFDAKGENREEMSKIRKRIAETLVTAQNTAAILTTFNEIDMTAVLDLRTRYKERFQEVHGTGLGFLSFFARAIVLAVREFPRVNAFIDGNQIVYHNFVHLGIAVSTDRGLAVPVLRNVQDLSFGKIESEIKRLATATRDGKLNLEELSGGTFTITNGGVFGSLLSTPILMPPQSAILGLHAIQKRPVVVNDQIAIRSMMYVALSYDHRLVDGRESVSFLVRIKQLIEDPQRLMLEI
jgi:2-oxoglutarate dehydrogenase E2 component (dihydrolipoamide succinyltransferase)